MAVQEVYFVKNPLTRADPNRMVSGQKLDTPVVHPYASDRLGEFLFGLRAIVRNDVLVAMVIAVSNGQTKVADILAIEEGQIGVVYPDLSARLLRSPRLVLSNGVDLREQLAKSKKERIRPIHITATGAFAEPDFRWGQRI